MLIPVLLVCAAAAQAPAPMRGDDSYARQAMTLYRRAEWDRLLALANARLAVARPDDPMMAEYLLTRGEAYSELHNASAAREALDQALPLAEAAHQTLILAKIHRHRGLVLWRFDRDLAAAEHEYEVALDFAKRAHDPTETVNVLIVAANPYRGDSTLDLPRALGLYLDALAIVRREQLSGLMPILLKNIGDTYRQQGDLDRAETVLTEGMQRADAADATEQRWATRLELGMIARARRHVQQAERYYLESLDILDVKESSLLLEDFRAGALAGALLFADPYDEYIDFLMEQGRAADAFLVAERQRARVFLDTLSSARDALARTAPAGFAAQERDLLTRIKAAQAEIRAGRATDARRSELLAAVSHAETNLDALRLRLAVANPALAHARYPKLWTVAELQRTVIADDEALVSLYLGTRRSFAWVVTRDRVATIVLPASDRVASSVRDGLAALRDPLAAGDRRIAALSRAIRVDDVVAAANRRRIVVVPAGALFDVPFDALVDGAGRPLVERLAFTYAPSASALAFLRSETRRPGAPAPAVIAVANPVVNGQTPPARRPADLAHLDLLSPVPETANEAHAIVRLFGQRARVLEGRAATRTALDASGIEHARILHFATHGLIDEDRPERSGLILTADPPRDDGVMQMRQIYGLHLDADLVTLSGCDTALGQHVTGEGMIGLTRAFFYAGARAVVASLWDVEDTVAPRLMQAFYAQLRSGQPIDVALQQAKLAVLREGGDAARPYYWASFVVSGQAHGAVVVSAPIPARRSDALGAVVAVAAILLVGVAAAARGRAGKRLSGSEA